MSDPREDEWHVISTYTRAQAIADGFLVDVSPIAREAGITFPVALTIDAWVRCVKLPEEGYPGQDQPGRLWDVVWMFRCAARCAAESQINFELYVRNIRNDALELVTLKAICGPGDTLDPVITIMLPNES